MTRGYSFKTPLLAAGTALALTLCGCDGFLPADGPTQADVEQNLRLEPGLPIQLVTVSPEILGVMQTPAAIAPSSLFTDLGPQQVTLGPGDELSISVIEPSDGGLFSGLGTANATSDRGAQVTKFDGITVDPAGKINFPFVGSVTVAGMEPNEIATDLAQRLSGQAVQPQVLVNVTKLASARITLTGAVKNPGTQEITSPGQTLLQAIAMAGGSNEDPNSTMVQLTRSAGSAKIRMQTLLDHPETNIHVRTGDYVNLYDAPPLYTMLGAFNAGSVKGENTAETLPVDGIDLATAIAKAGGLTDQQAAAQSVYLFRFDNQDIATRVSAVQAKLARRDGTGTPLSAATATQPLPALSNAGIPTVYQIDLRTPGGWLMAAKLPVHEGDIVYVADARGTQWKKFVDLIRMDVLPTYGARF